MQKSSVEKMTCARIPTDVGEFTLCLYRDYLDEKEHLALLVGDIAGRHDVLVRVHSECFTGDVLGSQRCDCGSQLATSMRLIAAEGHGIILYLRQEGRGIGLLDKLRAYNLQDIGYDTVDANIILGHQADQRNYRAAAHILRDLGVQSLRLLTNNPSKISGLTAEGLIISERIPLEAAVTSENIEYLNTKVRRMHHLLNLGEESAKTSSISPINGLEDMISLPQRKDGRPFVTLSYAQSLDGSIAARSGEQTAISGREALHLTHALRARHDALLIGIGTALADDPRLTVRYVEGHDPWRIVLDSHLRLPQTARLLNSTAIRPLIATTAAASKKRQKALESAGARVVRLPANTQGQVDLSALMAYLAAQNVASIMVEGGAAVITNFLSANLVDRLVVTVAPGLLGGLAAVQPTLSSNGRWLARLDNPKYYMLGQDIILSGDLHHEQG